MTKPFAGIAIACCILAAGEIADEQFGPTGVSLSVIGAAQARIGRPLTPGSVAGVARRTTRRVVRRSTIYAASLPRGCVVVNINGAKYWQCGGTYYASSGGRYVVVYID
jgi:hypothetical protein